MPGSSTLGAILNTLFERRPFARRSSDNRSLTELCEAILAERAEASTLELAGAALGRYAAMPAEERTAFFAWLNESLDIDGAAVAELATAYAADPAPETYRALIRASESRRLELFRRLNQVPGGTAELVRMRADLLALLHDRPELGRTDQDFVHLLRSWFNRGFLVLRRITWDSPASILEKIIAYEAVHAIRNWDDLRRRLEPQDRRLFAFFHPAMPAEPLIFVEVALMRGVPSAITEVLDEEREVLDPAQADTAVFYSISNCQKGLSGISFGNSLIKQVVRDLAAELPHIRSFVTLSPIPGLSAWLQREGLSQAAADAERLRRLTAHYLLNVKTADGRPLDPVARFHLGNGASVHAIHLDADPSEQGRARSHGVMVNYLYDLRRIGAAQDAFERSGEVAASPAVRALARQAKPLLAPPEAEETKEGARP
ncbi:MAG: decarboxylase [Alphaproteobacteria bacterium]|nr:MAG: decarboxylase [Alphaproteobacteria bacterium]